MTTYELIESCRPASILDVVPREVFYEIDHPGHEYIKGGDCYEWKYAVAKALKPKSVLEIGVRFGYSLACFICASGADYVEGIDSEVYEKGSNAVAWANLKRFCVTANLRSLDSKNIQALDRWFDLVHIDGSHNYDICLHDLRLCIGKTSAILVDDFHGCDDDRRAVKTFMADHPQLIKEAHSLPSHTGDCLILLNR